MSSKYLFDQWTLQERYPNGMTLGTMLGLGDMDAFRNQDFHAIPYKDFVAMIGSARHELGHELCVLVIRNKATGMNGERVVVEQFLVHVPKDSPLAILCDHEPRPKIEPPPPLTEKEMTTLSRMIPDENVQAAQKAYEKAKEHYEKTLKEYYQNL